MCILEREFIPPTHDSLAELVVSLVVLVVSMIKGPSNKRNISNDSHLLLDAKKIKVSKINFANQSQISIYDSFNKKSNFKKKGPTQDKLTEYAMSNNYNFCEVFHCIITVLRMS